eukprot:Hpha_TRINITY_DN13210_c0_g1::TRINITY_DN13210_c0_g1_i1::g.154471::m.154471
MTTMRLDALACAASPARLLSPHAPSESQDSEWAWRRNYRKEVDYDTGSRVSANRWENNLPSGRSPRPRSGHTVCVDHGSGKAILFGGLGDDTGGTGDDPVLNDLWTYDLVSCEWEEIEAGGTLPVGVFGHTAEIIDRSGASVKMLVYGGQIAGGLLTGAVYVLEDVFGDAKWQTVQCNVRGCAMSCLTRWGHSMVMVDEEPGGDKPSVITGKPVHPDGEVHLLVMGGMGDGFLSLDDVIALDVRTMEWTVLCQPSDPSSTCPRSRPQPRRRHVAILQQEEKVMWLFGGRSGWNSFHDDLWRFDIRARQWHKIPKPAGSAVEWPSPRTGHCGATVNDQFVVFGGFELRNASDYDWVYVLYDDLWSFHMKEFRWERLRPDEAGDMGCARDQCGGQGQVPSWQACVRVREETARPSDLALLSPQSSRSSMFCRTHKSSVDAPAHICAGRSGPCTVPRQRSMAAAFVHSGRLYIHGGRDKDLAFECFFSLPFVTTSSRNSLFEAVAQYMADTGVPYWESDIPDSAARFLDTLFQTRRRVRSEAESPTGGLG